MHIHEEPLYWSLSPPGAVHNGGCKLAICARNPSLCASIPLISCSVSKMLLSATPPCAAMTAVATIAPPPSGRSVTLPPNVLVSKMLPFALKYKGKAEPRHVNQVKASRKTTAVAPMMLKAAGTRQRAIKTRAGSDSTVTPLRKAACAHFLPRGSGA